MKQIKYSATAMLLALTIGNRAQAQEFGIELHGGMQGLQYTTTNGSHSLGFGGSIGVNYTYPLDRNWGILAGIAGGTYSSKAALQNATYAAPKIDDAGSAFNYDVQTSGYAETQHFFAASIPIMAQYHIPAGTRMEWYAEAGFKILFPFAATVKSSAQQIITSGYYPDFNIEVYDLPQQGFGTVTAWNGTTTQSLKPAVSFSIASGVCFPTASGKLYIGIYMDYGLNNAITKNNTAGAPVVYSPTAAANVQSVGVLNTSNVNNAEIVAFGLQLKFGLPEGSKKQFGGF